MYVVNTSFMVNPECHDKWYELITGRLVPRMRGEGFADYLFTRVLAEDSCPHYTYSLQVDATDIPSYQRFTEEIMGEYAEAAGPMFGEGVLYFTSLLKKIEV